jgi:hypothetical protein
VQTVCSPHGDLLWAAAPRPGAVVDVTAARQAGIAGDVLAFLALYYLENDPFAALRTA